ncbi:MAG: NYN domain-containing protein [Candidatus Dadabacteria bacterium]|nr:NYN domain-containing protein [Candidatus Dadabacteria bacterium]
MSMKSLRTTVYVDGLNLYYGCVKNTPFKWLDLKSLFSQLLKSNNLITQIKYFTAIVKPIPGNEKAPQRQQTYLRALQKHIPEISIHYGHFALHKVAMAEVTPPHNTVKVWRAEEKGSDVNLAVHLLNDAWLDTYDCAVIASNDSDMTESLKMVRERFPEKVIGLITPGGTSSAQLGKYAHFVRKIRGSLLHKSQMPDNIPGTTIRKPDDWS